MKKIQLTQRKFALVDDEDFERLNKSKWHAVKKDHRWYAYRRLNKRLVPMHREVLDVTGNLDVDHKDRNGLNNQKSNLRLCQDLQNSRNQRMKSSNSSGFKGISFDSRRNKFHARIKERGRIKHLGYFIDPRLAALAYDSAALKLFGEFACTNGSLGNFWNPHWEGR